METEKAPLDFRVAHPRQPAHPSIDRAQIDTLVETFYGRIAEHPRLGPIFESWLGGNWGPHLAKMKRFWATVLLKTSEYKGRPVPEHYKLRGGLESEDFQLWLKLFQKTAYDVLEDEEAAPIVIRQAEKIASSLWLAIFGDPFTTPPAFLTGNDHKPEA